MAVTERFLVTGGNRLSGEVAVGGAKNSVLKLMAASLLAEGTTTITNCIRNFNTFICSPRTIT